MEMHQIRYFLALRDERNFTRAAKRCGVTQPSLTNAIKRLEDELGGSLFRRGPGGAALSPLGEAVLPFLQQIEQLADLAKHEAANVAAANRLASMVNGGVHEQRGIRFGRGGSGSSCGGDRAPVAIGDRARRPGERDHRRLRSAADD
jgi:DNA-binding transcriptional LysR family regulator